jgi:hypothetical protein
MPLSTIVQSKVKEWFKKLKNMIDSEDMLRFGAKARDLMAMGELFNEDDEWSQELVEAGVSLSYVGLVILRDFEDRADEDKEKIKSILDKHFDSTEDSIDKNDWLQFHKAIRKMLFDLHVNY